MLRNGKVNYLYTINNIAVILIVSSLIMVISSLLFLRLKKQIGLLYREKKYTRNSTACLLKLLAHQELLRQRQADLRELKPAWST